MPNALPKAPRIPEERPGAPRIAFDPKLRDRLEAELAKYVKGEVRFGAGDRALYATDASNYRSVPLGLVVPRSVDEVMETIAICHKYRAPVLSRGGGTDLAGAATNSAVILEMSKYLNRVIEIDPERRLARVQPGCVLDHLRDLAEKKHGLTFGPDPATHDHCTLGGMIGNNSCGVHSVLSAKIGGGARTSDNVRELEVLTYDGLRLRVGPTSEIALERIIRMGGRRAEIYLKMKALRDRHADLIRARFPKIPRRVSGYNLEELLPERGFNVARALVGSEGTLVTVLEATLELIPAPRHRALAIFGFPSIYEAADQVPEIMAFGPAAIESIDDFLIENMKRKNLHTQYLKYLPEGKGFLLVEFTGNTEEEAHARAGELVTAFAARGRRIHSRIYGNLPQEESVWQIRESGLGATARVPGEKDTWPGWEDSAVPIERLGTYLRRLRALLDKYGYQAALYGHFGQGCVHTRIPFDLKTPKGLEHYRSFLDEATELCVSHGGSISGEHGDGQSRGELLEKMYGPELMQAFRDFKSIWDPEWKMNPGKVIDARPIMADLRVGPEYSPLPVRTYFHYSEDEGSFARATTRCVGVGKCRRTQGGTMCPSYKVTLEEKHSTRGRAHLLFEMLQGSPVPTLRDAWNSEAVKESLDLCLACKGCKGECPVNVDIATYKAEFLAHYYKTHRRPVAAYSMGFVHYWSRLASFRPEAVNLIFRNPLLSSIAKSLAGIERRRSFPLYAPETFQNWFKKREPKNVGRSRVILWPDTFNNHFHTETAKSATRVLEAAGFQVEVPQGFFCCGRPLYDFGFLHQARKQLRRILGALRSQIRAGVPIVGLEPSCVSVFRDELRGLFPKEPDATRLSEQTFTLAEFLIKKAPDFQAPRADRAAVVHLHCHHKSILGIESEKELMERMGLKAEILDSGCCGMAGSFGFEPGKFEVSQACGESTLLPKVREARRDALILTDGFSCRTQIAQNTQRQALHLAQVMDQALSPRSLTGPLDEDLPEKDFLQPTA